MRAILCFALIMWIGCATFAWLRVQPLAPDAVIRSGSTSPLICIFSNGTLATCRSVEDEDGNVIRTGPISWYDRRTGRLIKTVFSEQLCEIEDGEFVADRPPMARVIVEDEQVLADLRTGRILARLPTSVDEQPWDISPDGRFLAWMDPDNVQVVETATGKTVLNRPAVKLLGFHGNEIVGIRARDVDAADGELARSVALWLPDGTVADTESPISKSPQLSSGGDLLLKRVDDFQAAVCDARTGAVIWQTQIPFPERPDFIPWNMYRFNAIGNELLAVYGDDERRPRFARWHAKDGRVISALPTKLGPPATFNGVDLDPATGMTSVRTILGSPYENYDGAIASSDGRYVVQPYESSWEKFAGTLWLTLGHIETAFNVPAPLQLSALFDTNGDLPPQSVIDMTTGERVGTVGVGYVWTPLDASWFVVQGHSTICIYSAPFRGDWMSLVLWAFVPPIGLLIMTRLVGRALRLKRRHE
jgi:hypothetical protein